jgi:RNA polymerase sigma-70 factor (ECF subfamily)
MNPASPEVTLLLEQARAGDGDASKRLVEVLYRELRALAGAQSGDAGANRTLHPTALVHEVYVRLAGDGDSAQVWNDRGHFMAVASLAMRQVLSDHVRARRAQKRGGAWDKVSLDEAALPAAADEIDVIALHDALEQLAQVDARKHRVVELRYFGGLTIDETAGVLSISTTTVESEWRLARAWLAVRLGS